MELIEEHGNYQLWQHHSNKKMFVVYNKHKGPVATMSNDCVIYSIDTTEFCPEFGGEALKALREWLWDYSTAI